MTGVDSPGTITRRTLLLAGAGAAATAAIPSAAHAASKRWSERFRPHLLRSTYEPLVGQEFTVGGWAGSTRVRLALVRDIPNLSGQTPDFKERAFILVFQGAKATPLEAATYRFKHKKTGAFDLSITSSNEGWDTQDYTVVVANARRRAKNRKKLKVKKPKRPRTTYEDRTKARRERKLGRPKPPAAAPAPEPAALKADPAPKSFAQSG